MVEDVGSAQHDEPVSWFILRRKLRKAERVCREFEVELKELKEGYRCSQQEADRISRRARKHPTASRQSSSSL